MNFIEVQVLLLFLKPVEMSRGEFRMWLGQSVST